MMAVRLRRSVATISGEPVMAQTLKDCGGVRGEKFGCERKSLTVRYSSSVERGQ